MMLGVFGVLSLFGEQRRSRTPVSARSATARMDITHDSSFEGGKGSFMGNRDKTPHTTNSMDSMVQELQSLVHQNEFLRRQLNMK